jgi:hypothetical protein
MCYVAAMNISTSTLVGHVRRFGPHGVLYEIMTILDGKRALIRVIDTEEEVPYSLEKILADPTE